MGPTRGGGASGKPRGKMTAYAYFVQYRREKIRKERPDEPVNFADHSRSCSALWKEMGAAERKQFVDLQEQDKKRHAKEMRDYVPPAGAKGAKGRKAKKDKDPDAPKRSLSGFFWFCNDERPKIRAANPSYTVGDVAKELGKMWQVIDPALKQKYEQMASRDKERYQKELEAYKKKLPRTAPPARIVMVEEDDDDDDDEDMDEEEDDDDEEEDY